MTRRQQWAVATVVTVVLLAAWWALIAPNAGFAWPYPQRLPDQISFRGIDYRSDHTCLSSEKVLKPFGTPGAMHLVGFGSVPSAVVFGGPETLAALARGTSSLPPGLLGVPGTIYVRSGDCFVTYSMVQGPL